MAGDFTPCDVRVPFGLVAIAVGVFLLYAVFAPFPLTPTGVVAGEHCEVTQSPGVHLTTDWTLEIRDACGDLYPYARLFVLSFVVAGGLLVAGGAVTVHDRVGN